MASAKLVRLIVVAGLLAAAALLAQRGKSACPDFSRATVQVSRHHLTVALAATPAEHAQGLSGCRQVPDNSGLFFPFNDLEPRTFWMRGMRLPIDIIWIADGVVVGLNEHVPPPAPDTADTDLPLYHAPQPVNAVLELIAGAAQRLQISPGTAVTLTSY